ncbi:thioesterase family protein [Tepidamorphus sp. 3E244]|uniref:thioesterase family protein n=1 Tax=Tepidamorphus sp. 3E244 TaxID=3385498 RepID=UPI0038FCF06F
MSSDDVLERDLVIDEARLVTFLGPDLRVYGTPRMLLDVEMACRDLLLQHLADGNDSVGVGAQLQHLGGAVEGDTVHIRVHMTQFDGRRAEFEAEVSRKGAVIGSFTHQRAVMPLDKLKKRIAAMKQDQA